MPFTASSAILAAKLQIIIDFGAAFGRNMTEEVANSHFPAVYVRK